MATTLNDIAKAAGLSVSTVSRVLNNQAEKFRISRGTEKLVLETAQQLNYRPNPLARGLRLQRTHTIGLVVPDIANPFFAYVTKSIQKVAHKIGYSLVVCDTDEDLTMEVEHTRLLFSKSVDGLIVLPVGQAYEHLVFLEEDALPLVLLDRCFDEFKTDSVVVDNYQGAFEATEYLIECGHRQIAVIQGLPGTYTNNGRLNGYRDALAANNIPPTEELIVGRDFRKESGYVETKFLLNLSRRPTAIFAFGDMITFGAMQAISEEGLRVPEDISFVTFDDIDFAPFLMCPLTAVSQPREVMGEMAIKLLAERIEHPAADEKRRIVLKPRLVVRESVKNLRLETVTAAV